MGRMRYPSLSLHGIEGAFHGVGAKTVIPAKVAGKFSIRLALVFLIALKLLFYTQQQSGATSNTRESRSASYHIP